MTTRRKTNKRSRSTGGSSTPIDPILVALRHCREAMSGLLNAETQALIDEGAAPNDIVWLLSPILCGARLVSDAFPWVAAVDVDLAQQLGEHHQRLQPNQILCVYVEPGGFLAVSMSVGLVAPTDTTIAE